MIDEDTRKTVLVLYKMGKTNSEISRTLKIDRKTIRAIVAGKVSGIKKRADAAVIDTQLLQNVFQDCNGYAQRTFEVLTEQHQINIGYSTLTRMLRDLGLTKQTKPFAYQEPDKPGEEMQHDTSPFVVNISGKKVSLVCSGLYMRYSKLRYIKFYPSFNRFKMKCFMHEALMQWGYSAKICIIDNTNLAIYSGSGSRAVIVRDMEIFGHQFGFTWKAHEIGHSNRKAGKERNFRTIETNFLPGRSFHSLEDLNQQALDWATKRWMNRPLSKTRLIPAQLFENEKPFLIKIPCGIYAPYQPHMRTIDQYGYISFGANFYWTGQKAKGEVHVLEYDNSIQVCVNRLTCGKHHDIRYALPPWKTKNQKYFPPGVKKPKYEPRHIHKSSDDEQTYLRNLSLVCKKYLDFVFSKECAIKQKHKFTRDLYHLSRKTTLELFTASLERAFEFKIADIQTISRILRQILQLESYQLSELPDIGNYQNRESYREGQFSVEEQDASHFKNLMYGDKNKPSKENDNE